MMPRPATFAVASILLLSLAAAVPPLAAGPPPEVSSRLEDSIKFLKPGWFIGSYTTTTRSVVSKRDGSAREETVLVQRDAVLPDGRRERQLVSATKNGKDVTDEERKRFQTEVKPRDNTKEGGKAGNGGGQEFILPFEEGNEKLFTFGEPAPDGELLVQTFYPGADHRKDAGMTRGRVAWNPQSLDPAWIEFTFARMPSGVSEFLLRFEFARAGEEVALRRMVTSGVGGFLWIKRRFSAEVEFSDIVRGGPGPAAPAKPPAATPPS